MTKTEDAYWSDRYRNDNTGWDIGHIATPLKEYMDQLTDQKVKVLIPGAGNAYEAEYLHRNGYENVYVLDVSREPLNNLKKRVPDFPSEHLIHDDFFQHEGEYNLILEQTFFCSFEPTYDNRSSYARQMAGLLSDNGQLVGLWFKHALILGESKRPFGGSKEEYINYFSPYFEVSVFEDCYNSIPPRAGNELFGIFIKK